MPQMKITKNDYKILEKIVLDRMTVLQIQKRENYPNMTVTRYIWDIFHAVRENCQIYRLDDYLFLRHLDYLTDDNISAALKRILKMYI